MRAVVYPIGLRGDAVQSPRGVGRRSIGAASASEDFVAEGSRRIGRPTAGGQRVSDPSERYRPALAAIVHVSDRAANREECVRLGKKRIAKAPWSTVVRARP